MLSIALSGLALARLLGGGVESALVERRPSRCVGVGVGEGRGHREQDAPDGDFDQRADFEQFQADRAAGGVGEASAGQADAPQGAPICGPQGRALIHFVPSVAMAFLGRLEEARAGARAGLALNPHFTIARYRATFGDTGISACSPIPFAERRSVWTVAR